MSLSVRYVLSEWLNLRLIAVPHDVPGLIELCVGPDEFLRRLDIFFDEGYYDMTNQPSSILKTGTSASGGELVLKMERRPGKRGPAPMP